MRRKRIDPGGRKAALLLAAARLGVGAGALFATDPFLRVLGFPRPNPTGRALARVLGGRDLALAALTVAARGNRSALAATTLAAAILDAADAASLGFAMTDPRTRLAGCGGVLSGGAAAVTGAWAWRRLA